MVKGLIKALKNTKVDIVLSSAYEPAKIDCGNCIVQLIEKRDISPSKFRKIFLIGVCKNCHEVCFVSDPPGKRKKLEQYKSEILKNRNFLKEMADKHCKCCRYCKYIEQLKQ